MEIPAPESLFGQTPTMDIKSSQHRGAGLYIDDPESWDDASSVATRTYAVIDDATIDPTTGEAGEYYQYWSEGDAISLFMTRTNLQYSLSYYMDGNLDIGKFELVGDEVVGQPLKTQYFYSVYPYKASTTINTSTGKITYEFPQTQHYCGDTYANGENGMIAIEPKDGSDGILYYKNFCSYLQLRLAAAENQPKVVKKITLTSNSASDYLSGKGLVEIAGPKSDPVVTMNLTASTQITLDCGSGVTLSNDENAPTKFWFVLPGNFTFSEGFSVSVIFENNYYFRKTTPKSIGIDRSHIKPMATIKPDALLANGPIRYKYNNPNDTEPFPLKNTFFGEGGVTLDILDQTYDEETGEWVVLLSGTLKKIGDNSFQGPGPDIEYIKVNNGDESVTISDFAFYNCTADYLAVYNPVDQIRNKAFSNSTIKDLNIYGDVGSINTGVGTDAHIENIIVEGNVGTIGEEAFDGSSICSIDIRGNVESIDSKAFHSCESLSEIKVDGNINLIGEEAFASCHQLETLEVGGDVDNIGTKAFYDNDKLHTLDIVGSIGEISSQAFYDCDALETLNIDGDIKEIGQEAFSGCDILNTVSIQGNIESIGNRAFYDNDNLYFVDIHGTIGTIGEEAFSKCDLLEKVHVTGNIETIGIKAFYDSDNLHQLLIDGSVDVIKREAFSSCDELETVTLYGDIKTIDTKAFYDSNNLQDVHITGSVETIKDDAFSSCDLLKNVVVDGDVELIDKHAFKDCKQLQKVSVLSIESIGQEAFYGCSSLSDLNIPGVKYLGIGAFQNCTSLESINLDSVIIIQDAAFFGCYTLKTATISQYCTMIGEGAFCNASSLEEVYLYAVDPPFIKTDNTTGGSYVFAGTYVYLTIYIPYGSYDSYTNDAYFKDHTYDDPAIKANVNWWYQEYMDYLYEME